MYANIEEVITAVTKRHAINEETQKRWRESVMHIYAGHFIVVLDGAKLGEGGGKHHVLFVNDRGDYEHVYESYDKDYAHMIASWFETTGPFTNVDTQIVNESNRVNGSRSYFSPANMRGFKTKVFDYLYAGRFFITRDKNRLSNGRTETFYRILAVTDDVHDVIVLTPLHDCFDSISRAKYWINKLTKYAGPRTTKTPQELKEERINAAHGIGTLEAVQQVIDEAIAAHHGNTVELRTVEPESINILIEETRRAINLANKLRGE